MVVRPGEYTSCIFPRNIRPVKLKTRQNAFQGLKKLFEGNLLFPPGNTGIWLFARANILHVFSREINVQWSSNKDKNAFQVLRKLFESNMLFARRALESGYLPGRIYFMYFFFEIICYSPGEHLNLVIRPVVYTSCIFSRNIRPMKLKPR